MPFIHPLIFWLGLGGASIPILIYLLMKRRYKKVNWGAMDILLRALKKNKSRMKIEELILLAIRCLLVLFITMLIGRFVGCDSLQMLEGSNAGRIAIFVLDDTCSMGQKRGKKVAFDFAKQDLKDRIEDLKIQDKVAIVLASQPSTTKPFFALGKVEDKKSLNDKIDRIKLSDKASDLPAVLKVVNEIIPAEEIKAEELDCTVYLLSDYRNVDFEEASQADAVAKQMKKIDEAGGRFAVFSYGSNAKKNLTIETVELATTYAMKSKPTKLRVKVRNTGNTSVAAVQVKLALKVMNQGKLDSQTLANETIATLGAGQQWVKEIDYTPESAGNVVVVTTLPGDELLADNTYNLSLNVKPFIKVLIVDGRPVGSRPSSAESYFLQNALDSVGNKSLGFSVNVIRRDDITLTNFDEYDAVCLLAVTDFPTGKIATADPKVEKYPSVARLEKFVQNGGGLFIFCGNGLDTNFYNGRLYKEGLSLCPFKIGARLGDPKDRSKFNELDIESIRVGGMLDYLVSGGRKGISHGIRFYAYSPAIVDKEFKANAVAAKPIIHARFNDKAHSPALVSRKFGQGNVAMFYSSASLSWNDWAMDDTPFGKGLYVVPMSAMVESICKRQDAMFTRKVASPIEASLPHDWRDSQVSVTPPGTGARTLKLPVANKNAARPTVTFNHTDTAGVYKLKMAYPSKQQFRLYSRNIETREGLLKTISKADLIKKFNLENTEKFVYVDRSDINLARLSRKGDDQKYWVWLIAICFVLLFAETYFAQRFAHWQ